MVVAHQQALELAGGEVIDQREIVGDIAQRAEIGGGEPARAAPAMTFGGRPGICCRCRRSRAPGS